MSRWRCPREYRPARTGTRTPRWKRCLSWSRCSSRRSAMKGHRPSATAHPGRRRPAVLLAMLALAPYLAACSSDSTSGLELDTPAAVREFLAGQSLDGIHGYQPLLVESLSQFLLFKVSYGAGTACSAVCEYPT